MIPAIYGNIIVWQDKRNGIDDIYMYNLCTKRETRITNTGSASSPNVYGDKIVWDDSKNFNTYMYDLSTHKETKISTNGGLYPAIYGDRIVYQAIRTSAFNIFLYNISTHKETQITNCGSGEYAGSPAIYSDRIVYQSYRNGKNDIYMYNISTHKETQITSTGLAAYSPKIYGNKIVWVDTSNGWDKLNLYMYDLSIHKETKIVTNASDSVLSASIYDDNVVWGDARHVKSFIRMYNISTGRIINITCNRSSDEPNIYGDRVVWRDYRHGGNEIYMATLINPPIAASSISPSVEKTWFCCKKSGYFTKPVKNITNGIFICHKQVNNDTKSNSYSLKRQ